jgi:phosphatidylinositol alpha 1,6-mannosyltransferase
LEQEILAAGHAVCILTTTSGDSINTHLDGTHPQRKVLFLDNAIPIPFLHDPNNDALTYSLGFALSRTIQREIAEFDPTIIHVTVPDCTCLHLIQWARTHEIPIMGTYHSNIPEYMDHYPGLTWLKYILGGFFRHQYNFLQALYVPTPYIHKFLTDNYQMDKVTNVKVWGRGVDIDKFHPMHRSLKFRRDLGIADDAVVVCWVGRLVPEKRPDIFAEVVRRLAARHVDFHAICIGAGVYEDEIKTLPHTTFCGWMNADQLAVAYASSDVFLFPSSVETFGNVTLEAMASGLPIVVEAGCSGHLVRNGVNGYACPSGDADAFYEATYELVTKTQLRWRCAEESRQLSRTMEKRVVVRQMLDHYSKVTEEFYTEYGGRHMHRDTVYQHTGSFRAGNHPRPLILVIVEYLFIVLFRVIWNMTSMFVYVQGSMMPGRGSPPTHGIIKKHHQPMMVDRMPVIEEVGSRDEEDLSLSTVSDSDEEEEQPVSSLCFAPSCSDCGVSHALAKSFMAVAYFQCRMESHLRNGARTCMQKGRKRKNSFDFTPMEAEQKTMVSRRKHLEIV